MNYRYKGTIKRLRAQIPELDAALEDIENEVNQLRSALSFYAHNWHQVAYQWPDVLPVYQFLHLHDGGERARKALGEDNG